MADINTASLPEDDKVSKTLVETSLSNAANVESGNQQAPNSDEGSNCLKRALDNDADEAVGAEAKKLKLPKKKKVALLMSYCGQGYLGMQNNQGFKTIEGDLFEAFKKLGIMDEESFKVPQTIHFQRAARTDKGVSAMRQVISFKMSLTEEDHVSNICAHLPPCIRVFALKKVTQGFNSKISCDGRSYAYILPTFAFAPLETIVTHDYRMPAETVVELNNLLAMYKGTRNYHNFTSKRPAQDPSSKRYVTEFSCGQPFLVKEMEFVKLKVKGQSFVLHQIRKMVGLAIAIMRGYATKETLEKAFMMERMDIPIAPGLNLLLEEPHYDSYNRRYGKDGLHEPLAWDAYKDQVEQFFSEHIMPVIYNGEKEENSMMTWMTTLQRHTYSVREEVPLKSDSLLDESAIAAVAAAAGNVPPNQINSTPGEDAGSDSS